MNTETLAYLDALADRITDAQLLAQGTAAWPVLRRLAEEVREKVAEELAEMDRQTENDYFTEEQDCPCQRLCI